ncbi:MAG: transposase family protein [Tannerellaceae bacterium]|nr:transposase family protein [Tannerellaceae bacterium]
MDTSLIRYSVEDPQILGELSDRNHLRVQYLLDKCDDVLLDGTERPIERPQDTDRQKSCYSGKKTHNVKNNLLCTSDKRIHSLAFKDL